jgi:hypothetical protein
MNDIPYRLAYEASVRAIEDQARVLESLRSRAGTIFAAAALVTTFLSSEALGGGRALGDFKPLSLDGVVLAAFLACAGQTLMILWPFRLRFSLSAAGMIKIIDDRGDPGVTATEAYREVALQLESLYDRNRPRVVLLLWFFRGAILSLMLEVGAWLMLYWRLEGG